MPRSKSLPSSIAPSEVATPSPTTAAKVENISPKGRAPAWLRSLWQFQYRTKFVCALLFCALPISYCFAAYTQDQWKRQHGQLKRLQDREIEQAIMTQTLKQQMSQAAQDPKNGLVDPTPDRLVFIPSASPRPLKPVAPPPTTAGGDRQVIGY
jgi:uncharacterized protein HemX